jgi:7 transmembrane receptor (rhodopsin family)
MDYEDIVDFIKDIWEIFGQVFPVILIILVGMILNVLLLIVILKDQKMRSNSLFHFIVAILVLDFCLPLTEAMNAFVDEYQFLLNDAMLLNVQVGFTVDRYFTICHPLTYYNYKDSGYRKWIIVASVIVSLVLVFPIWYGKKNSVERYNLFALWHFVAILVVLVLFVLMAIEMARMVRKLNLVVQNFDFSLDQKRKRNELTSSRQNDTLEIQMTITLFLTVASFVVCWGPLTVFIFRRFVLDQSLEDHGFMNIFSIISMNMNSFFDSIIFIWRLKSVRKEFMKTFCCCCQCQIKN